MQLANLFRLSLVVAATASAACGPAVSEEPDWILGTFSSGVAGIPNSTATRYTFEKGGTVVIERESACEAAPSSWTMAWEPVGEDSVVLRPLEGEDPFPDTELFTDHTFVRQDDNCLYPLAHHAFRDDGSPALEFELVRGALCTERQPPCDPPGSQCDPCMLTWCDGGEPEACDP